MSTLKTHNLQSPDAGSVNIALTANAGMIVTGISTFNNRIDIGSLGVTTNFTVAGISTFTGELVCGVISVQNSINIPDKLIHSGDANTCVRFPAVDTITAETGGTERFRIASDGNVGVGTDNPTNKLSVCNGGIKVFGAATPNINFSPVHGNSGNADISFDASDLKIISNSSSANVRIGAYSKLTHFVIKASGRIGIGTDNPSSSSLLHLYSTTADPYLRIGSGTRDCGITLQPNSAFTAMRSDAANRLFVNAGADSIRFSIGGTTDAYKKLTIDTNGRLILNNSEGIQLSVKTSGLYATNGALSYYGTTNGVYLNGAGDTGWLRVQAAGSQNDRTSINLVGHSASGNADTIYARTNSTERFRIHSTGQVTKPASCAFNVTPNGNQSLGNNETLTSWKTTDSRGFENTTTGGYFGSGIFTAPVTGAYYFTSNILLYDTNGTNSIHLYWQKNGSGTHTYWNTRFNSGDFGYQNYMPVAGACTMYMNAGDTCRIRISFSGSNCGMYGSDQNWGNWGGFLIG